MKIEPFKEINPPDEKGYWINKKTNQSFGGQYASPVLLENLKKLEVGFKKAMSDKTFIDESILNEVGKNMTVWGIQKVHGNPDLSVEYYFYTQCEKWMNNYSEAWNRIRKAVNNVHSVDLEGEIPVDFPVGMFSMDIPKNGGKISSLDIYHIVPGEGYCVTWKKDQSPEMKNYYWFSHTSEDAAMCLANHNIPAISMLFGNYGKWDSSICLSRKKDREFNGQMVTPWSVYYSGSNVDTTITFLERFQYPKRVQEFFRREKNNIDHMKYDFGYDFITLDTGGIECIKSGFYGSF